MAHTVSNASLQGIYNRLHDVERYHPMDADTFADWSMEAGDQVTVQRQTDSYVSPVHTSRMVWKKAPETSISSGGNEKRESIAQASRNRYNSGGGGLRSTRRLYESIIVEYENMRAGLEITASWASLYVQNKYDQMKAGLDLTSSSASLYVDSKYDQMKAGLDLTSSSASLYVDSKYDQMKAGLDLTSSSAALYVRNLYRQMQSGLEVTMSSATLYARNRTTRAYIMTRINASGEGEALIDADKVSITGDTTINDVFSVTGGFLHAKKSVYIEDGDNQAITLNASQKSIMTDTFIVRSDGGVQFRGGGSSETIDYSTLSGMVKSFSVEDGVLTLTPFVGDPVNFRKTTSVSGSWSGNTFTVVASASGKQSESVTVYPKIDGTEQYANFSAEVGTYDDGGNWIRRGDSLHGYLWQPTGASYVQVRTEANGGGIAIARMAITGGGDVGNVTIEKAWSNNVLQIQAKNSSSVVVGTDTYDPPLELAGTTQYDNFTAQVYEVVSGQHQSRKSVRGKMVLTANGASSYVDVKPNLDGTGTSVARLAVGSLYTAGRSAATVGGSWAGGRVTAKNNSNESNLWYSDLVGGRYTASWENNIATVNIRAMNMGSQTAVQTGASITIDASGIYSDGQMAAGLVANTETHQISRSTTGDVKAFTVSIDDSAPWSGHRKTVKAVITPDNGGSSRDIETAEIDATSEYNSGKGDATVSGSWSGGRVTAKNNSNNNNLWYSDLIGGRYTASWENNIGTINIRAMNMGSQSEVQTGASITVDAGQIYAAGRTDEAGTLTISTPTSVNGAVGGNATRTSISITASAKTTNSNSKTNPKAFTLARSSYTDSMGKPNQRCVELRDGTTNIGRINVMDDYNAGVGSVKLYKTAWSGGKVTISKSDSGVDTLNIQLTMSQSGPSGNNYTVSVLDGSTTVLSKTVNASERYNAGWDAVQLSGWTLLEPTGGNATERQGFKITIPNKTDGTPREQVKHLKMTAGSFTSEHKCNVYTRNTNSSYSTDGTYYLKYVVDATPVYNAGYDQGKKDAGGGSTVTINLTTPTQTSAYSSGGGGAGSPTGGASATQLTTLGNYLRNYKRGYVYFKVTAGNVTKWYSIATPS